MTARAQVRRARPWLGTVVDIRAGGLPHDAGLRAVEAAFAEIARVHRLMSFHEPDSDLSRLHRATPGTAVAIDVQTHAVIAFALRIAAESEGRFDPCIAAHLVDWRLLPAPPRSLRPDPRADWRDIELLEGGRVRLHRALWIDLGGIAKGHAVDLAIAALHEHGARSGCVNAGGDLRRFGGSREEVVLRLGEDASPPRVEIGDAAVATSVAAPTRCGARRWRGAHVNPPSGRAIRAIRAVSVVATACVLADALTKVVLADPRIGERLLRRHRATACLRGRHGFRLLGES